jgi:radical SAM superfamily enzyme YgiQ (UPF0313 family)
VQKKKVLLISFNTCTNPYPVFPLGVAYIAGTLLQKKYEISIVDRIISDDIEKTIKDFVPDFIGVSLRNIDDVRIDETVFFMAEIGTIIDRIRNVSDAPVVLGGSAFSLFPERILKISGADFGIAGEAEESLPTLLESISDDMPDERQLKNIPGLVYRSGNLIVKNESRPIDLNSVALPYRTENHFAYYNEHSSVVNIQTQRGCPFTCCYCTYPLIEGNTIRCRPAEAIAEEIQIAASKGAPYFFIVDSVFNTNREHIAAVCEEIIKRKITLPWGCFLRPSGLTTDLMQLLAGAGLTHIEFGSDSLCDSTLDSYGKCFTFEDIYESSELARNARIHYAHFLITGGPGENEKTLQESFTNSKRLKKTVFFPFTGMRLYPGTPLYKRAIEENTINSDFDLFAPYFYVSPQITKERIREILAEFNKEMPNWIVEDLPPEMKRIAEGLRKKGVTGPLWEFLAR